MSEMCRILQKPREFIDNEAAGWEVKSQVIFKYARDTESGSNSRLRGLLKSVTETGKVYLYT